MPRPRNVRPSTRSPGSRACAMPASTACGCAVDSRSVAIRSGGSRSCTCTSSRSIATMFRDADRARSARRARAATGDAVGPRRGHRAGTGAAGRGGARRRVSRPAWIPPRLGPDAGGDGRAGLGPQRRRARLAPALASRAPRPQTPATALAFVHRAFWRADAGDGSAEAYIGPVLDGARAPARPRGASPT